MTKKKQTIKNKKHEKIISANVHSSNEYVNKITRKFNRYFGRRVSYMNMIGGGLNDVHEKTFMMTCTSITIIYRLHADLLTCVHVDAYVVSNADMYCFQYLWVISHVSYEHPYTTTQNVSRYNHMTYTWIFYDTIPLWASLTTSNHL